jgi:hypothetical protein
LSRREVGCTGCPLALAAASANQNRVWGRCADRQQHAADIRVGWATHACVFWPRTPLVHADGAAHGFAQRRSWPRWAGTAGRPRRRRAEPGVDQIAQHFDQADACQSVASTHLNAVRRGRGRRRQVGRHLLGGPTQTCAAVMTPWLAVDTRLPNSLPDRHPGVWQRSTWPFRRRLVFWQKLLTCRNALPGGWQRSTWRLGAGSPPKIRITLRPQHKVSG